MLGAKGMRGLTRSSTRHPVHPAWVKFAVALALGLGTMIG